MDQVQARTPRVVKPGTKKRRPPLACILCYQRKLKCGRESPSCSRCVKTGVADQCTYRGDRRSTRPVDATVAEEGTTSLSSVSTGLPPQTSAANPAPSALSRGDMTHLKGQETITKFYGYSYQLNFYQQFSELPAYIAQIKAGNPAINSLRDQIYPLSKDECLHQSLVGNVEHEAALRILVPPRVIADTLVQTYVDRFETTHRVLDRLAFIAEYNGYWTNSLATPLSFLVQLVLVMAAAVSFHPDLSIDAVGQIPVHTHARRWVEAAEATLTSSVAQPQSWNSLVSHCLLLIAKRANYIQESSSWASTGLLVRWAMAAGYHREASPTARISPYYREMRRRLWATVIELDLQASIERGMPPSLRKDDFNAHSPLNLDDDKVQESLPDISPGMPLTTFTNLSFQVLLHRSLRTRMEICAFVNGCQGHADFDRVLKLEGELAEALQEIPEWSGPCDDPRQQQTARYVRNMLNIYLRQYSVLLHTPFAIEILEHYRELVDEGIVPGEACRVGLLLAAFNICHEIYKSLGPTRHSTMATVPKVSGFLLTAVENVLQTLEKRVTQTLFGLNEYYTLAMVIALIKSKLWPQSSTVFSKEAADRVIQTSLVVHSKIAVTYPETSHLESSGRPSGLNPEESYLSVDTNGLTDLFNLMGPEELGTLYQDIDFQLFDS